MEPATNNNYNRILVRVEAVPLGDENRGYGHHFSIRSVRQEMHASGGNAIGSRHEEHTKDAGQ
jgi:hypothetical protein